MVPAGEPQPSPGPGRLTAIFAALDPVLLLRQIQTLQDGHCHVNGWVAYDEEVVKGRIP
jgi:hypothetical protein